MTAICPRCGTSLPNDAPAQLCPRCLLQAGLESGAATPARGESPPTALYSTGFAAPSPEDLQKLFPSLEILELLGKGGMGAVYKAKQVTLDRYVAVKILPPQIGGDAGFAERFAREARSLAKLSHPNIVAVYDFGRTGGEGGGLFYFVMEYVDGVNIRQAMRAGTLSPAEALKVVPQVCDALQFAHDEGIVHRDIKPENILLDKKGRVKIADFGLAKLLGHEPGEIGLTGTQQVMGTMHYMAPEQVEGTKGVDHRADIYSLGVTFYEMLTGELPLGRFAPPSQKVQIDVRLDEVVLRTLEKEPDKRYQHVSQVKTEVENIGGASLSAAAERRLYGREYKSAATIFGVPLVHVAFGIDRKTGRLRKARGIIAVGDFAIGVLACGGVAIGGLAFGGIALGLISIGGLAIGLFLALGGGAIGGIAVGGLALGGVAVGGLSVGYYAVGGGGVGRFAIFGDRRDPEAIAAFGDFIDNWRRWFRLLVTIFTLLAAAFAFVIGLALSLSSSRTKPTALGRYFRWTGLPTLICWLLGVGPQLLILLAESTADRGQHGGGDRPAAAGPSMLLLLALGLVIPGYCHYLWAIFGQNVKDDCASQARHAGNWMFGMGIVLSMVACVAPVVLILVLQSPDLKQGVVFFVGLWPIFFAIVGAALLLAGGLFLTRLQDRKETRIAAVMAMLPLSVLWPFALPVGILVLRVLGRDDVRSLLKPAEPVAAKAAGVGPIGRLVRSRVLWIAVWSFFCAAVFWFAGTSSHSYRDEGADAPYGLIDRWYWPYRNTAEIAVSLSSPSKLGRIVVSEQRETSTSGWYDSMRWLCDGSRQPLSRNEIRVHLPDKDAKHDLVVDALGGLSSSYTDDAGIVRRDRTPLDKGVVVAWLEGIGRGDAAKDSPLIGSIADIVLLAATSDSVNTAWPASDRAPIGRLERIVVRQRPFGQGNVPDVRPFPFSDHVGTERITVAPIFNILWVSVPVTLVIWLEGMWLLRRKRSQAANTG